MKDRPLVRVSRRRSSRGLSERERGWSGEEELKAHVGVSGIARAELVAGPTDRGPRTSLPAVRSVKMWRGKGIRMHLVIPWL